MIPFVHSIPPRCLVLDDICFFYPLLLLIASLSIFLPSSYLFYFLSCIGSSSLCSCLSLSSLRSPCLSVPALPRRHASLCLRHVACLSVAYPHSSGRQIEERQGQEGTDTMPMLACTNLCMLSSVSSLPAAELFVCVLFFSSSPLLSLLLFLFPLSKDQILRTCTDSTPSASPLS